MWDAVFYQPLLDHLPCLCMCIMYTDMYINTCMSTYVYGRAFIQYTDKYCSILLYFPPLHISYDGILFITLTLRLWHPILTLTSLPPPPLGPTLLTATARQFALEHPGSPDLPRMVESNEFKQYGSIVKVSDDSVGKTA
jgi:hypothetical protein